MKHYTEIQRKQNIVNAAVAAGFDAGTQSLDDAAIKAVEFLIDNVGEDREEQCNVRFHPDGSQTATWQDGMGYDYLLTGINIVDEARPWKDWEEEIGERWTEIDLVADSEGKIVRLMYTEKYQQQEVSDTEPDYL